MSGWGSGWSAQWGDQREVYGTLWLYMNRDVPIFQAIGQIIDEGHIAILSVLRQIETAFDLTTAVGSVLDIFGAALGLLRNGLTDERYRRALLVQRSLILSSAGTRQAFFDVFSSWTQTELLEYYDTYPLEVTMGGTVALADEALLLQFIRTAAPGGRILNVYNFEAGFLLCDSTIAPVTSAGVMDSTIAPVSGAALMAKRII